MPAPSNDNFASAIALSTTLPGLRSNDTLVDATHETSEEGTWSGALSPNKQSVWYTFTPASTGRYRFALDGITAEGSGSGEVGLAIYTGSALGSLTELPYPFKNNQTGALRPFMSIVVDLTASTTYRIQVWSPLFTAEAQNTHVVSYDLSWDQVTVGTAPANDDIADAEDLGTDPADGSYPGSTDSATFEGWEGTGGYDQPTVWFRFHCATTATKEMHVIADAVNPYYQPYFEVYQIDTDPPTGFGDMTFITSGQIADMFTYPDLYDSVDTTISLVSGNDYAILVTDWDWNGEWGDFDLLFGAPPSPPANDTRANATLTSIYNLAKSKWGTWATYPDAKGIEGTTILATAEGGDPTLAGFAATRNVWYRTSFWNAGDQYKIWVESAVDCVLGVYKIGLSNSIGAFVAADDDSGPGNQPEVTITYEASTDYWIIVDSKTAGDFVLKYERIETGTPPANDDFASATVISSLPFSASGTTVDANAEPFEVDAEFLGSGPHDSVWYKYVAPADGQIVVRATCDTNNNDAYVYVDVWKGTTLAALVRATEPPRDFPTAFFNHFDTLEELEAAAITVDIASGQTYYIRVQTESGGSEGFTVYVDQEIIYLDLQASGTEEMHGTLLDEATIYLDLQHTGVEDFHAAISTDAATVSLLLTPITTYEAQGAQTVDSATIYLDLTILGGECYSRFHFTGEGEADARWGIVSDLCRWSPDDQVRWTALVEQQPGCE